MSARPGVLVALTLLAAAGACGPSEPFPGGRRLELDCIAEQRAPTAEEVSSLVDELVTTYLGEGDPADLSLVLVMDTYSRRDDSSVSNRARAVALLASGGRFRFESQNRGTRNLLLRDGQETWAILEGTEPGYGVGDRAKPIQWFDMALYPLRYLGGPGVTLEGLAPREENGRTLVPVVRRGTQEPQLTYLIDPAGPLIRAVEAVLPVTQLNLQAQVSEEVRFEYEDHRRDAGRLVPFTLRAFSEGDVAQVLDVIQVQWDPDLEGVEFRTD